MIPITFIFAVNPLHLLLWVSGFFQFQLGCYIDSLRQSFTTRVIFYLRDESLYIPPAFRPRAR